MENKYIDEVVRSFELDMPNPNDTSMDGYLREVILPRVRQWSEDLREEGNYIDKPWMEIRDDVGFNDTVLHFFQPGGNYMCVTNGNISGGRWEYMESANKFIFQGGKSNAMYDLAYLDDNFFILKKHGDQRRLGQPEYWVMGWEPVVKRLDWRDAMELMYNQYRENNNSYVTLGVFILVLIAIIILFSIF
ncbi:MAG: hypothetical protein AAGK47_06555 [Bacteroidota bacterium]